MLTRHVENESYMFAFVVQLYVKMTRQLRVEGAENADITSCCSGHPGSSQVCWELCLSVKLWNKVVPLWLDSSLGILTSCEYCDWKLIAWCWLNKSRDSWRFSKKFQTFPAKRGGTGQKSQPSTTFRDLNLQPVLDRPLKSLPGMIHQTGVVLHAADR